MTGDGMQNDRASCYDRMRALGVSVETADSVSQIVPELPEKQRQAFWLWLVNVPDKQIRCIVGCSQRTIEYMRHGLREIAQNGGDIGRG